MMDNNFTNLNNVDLEVGTNTNKQLLSTLTRAGSTLTSSGSTSGSGFLTSCCMKSFLWIIIMIFCFPITFCDLYYAYNDDSCISEPAGKLSINLKDYLLIYGWISASALIIFSIGLCFIGSLSKTDTCFVCYIGFSAIIFTIISIFSVIWNIFGAVIFWGLMDTSQCNKELYNYVFASLIIKLCFSVYGIFKGNNDNKK